MGEDYPLKFSIRGKLSYNHILSWQCAGKEFYEKQNEACVGDGNDGNDGNNHIYRMCKRNEVRRNI